MVRRHAGKLGAVRRHPYEPGPWADEYPVERQEGPRSRKGAYGIAGELARQAQPAGPVGPFVQIGEQERGLRAVRKAIDQAFQLGPALVPAESEVGDDRPDR